MNRLRELRKEKGVTQEQLAEMIGISQNVISDYEREVTPIPLLVALAIEAVWLINHEWLLTGVGNREIYIEGYLSQIKKRENGTDESDGK